MEKGRGSGNADTQGKNWCPIRNRNMKCDEPDNMEKLGMNESKNTI